MKILATSDWHLSTVRPACRVDEDWTATQIKHLNAVMSQEDKVDEIVVAGDVFDTPTVAPVLTNAVLKLAQCDMCKFIGGNHDLSHHNVKLIDECSFGAIRSVSDKPDNLFEFGTIEPTDESYDYVAIHTFAVEDNKLPHIECKTAKELCSMFPNTRVIVVGDNHEHWCKRIGDQLVVNCGTLIQRTASEAKRPCGFYLVDTDELTADFVDLSELSHGCIDTSYLEHIKEREKNRDDYEDLVSELKDSTVDKYDFLSALKEYITTNKLLISEGVYNILMGCVEEVI